MANLDPAHPAAPSLGPGDAPPPTLLARMWGFKGTFVYLLLIPFVNWSFTWAPMIPLPLGGEFTPVSILTGLVLVVRDFAQRELGHRVLLATLAAVALTAVLAGPALAFASGLAFLISELADWAVFTFTKRPLSQRILISSLVGAPIDTAVFLYLASAVIENVFNWATLLGSVAAKIFGAFVVAEIVARRERREARAHDIVGVGPPP